jgi:DNA repair exonuclease SbcCD nuclease subunit
MRFLHTGDLHLDSAFGAHGALGAQECRRRQRALLKRIIDLAVSENCDMMLIAGDLFDTVYVSRETQQLCASLFSEFARPIIIAPGNHDPYTEGGFYSDRDLPENVYVFNSSELQYFDFPELGVSVAGYAFTSPSLLRSPLGETARAREDSGEILLLCAHADVNSPTSRYAPLTVGDIVRHGFDYAALGHVHNVTEEGFLNGTARYCGFPEGRAFDEIGDGGVYIVDIDGEHNVTVTRHKVSAHRYLWSEVSVDGISEKQELVGLIEKKLADMGADTNTSVRLEIVGVINTQTELDFSRLEKELSGELSSLELLDETLCLPDGEYLEKDVTLKGEFYRTLRSSLYSDDLGERALALKALKIGLAAIEGRDFTDKGAEDENN